MTVKGKHGRDVNVTPGKPGFQPVEKTATDVTDGVLGGKPLTDEEKRLIAFAYLDKRLEETFGNFYNQTPGAKPTDRERGERVGLETIRNEMTSLNLGPEYGLRRLAYIASDDYHEVRTSHSADIDDDEYVAGLKDVEAEFQTFCEDRGLLPPPCTR